MLHSINEESQGRFVLPPISALDDYRPIFSSRPPSPPSLEKILDNSSHTTITTTPTPTTTHLRTISSDVDQVVQQAHGLSSNMTHYKPYLLSSTHHEELQPWMDDMIGRANQVLNALLRLRKHQMVTGPIINNNNKSTNNNNNNNNQSSHSPPPSSSASFSSSTSSSSSSASIPSPPLTKWPRSQHYFYHQNEMTSLPSRQRKRGKRATFQGRCHSCNISETPEWRRGPDGARTLCNACGLHYAKLTRKKAAQLSL